MGRCVSGCGGHGTQGRGHLLRGRDGVVLTRGGPGNRGLVAQVEGGWVVAAGGRTAVLVHGALHLLQDLVDLLEVTLGSQIWHGWQVVVLVHGAVCRVAATDSWESGCGSHVLGTKATGVDR